MTDIITVGASTIAPTVVLGYSSERAAQNIVHPILGAESPDVTLRPALLRSGTLSLGFSDTGSEGSSRAAETLLAAVGVGSLASTDRATVAMPFVVVGTVRRELEDATRNAWIVTFGYQETA
ncbi:hypothetical protein [Microbacterium rhizomatis]|uniref:Uncharacterized protein n=1 Tax=Microbacterium rhizomatis TaxID=1631477 RepID=A0A5J5IWB8_9MICO|nr:hypothetical protein [Microbacterium rhizomatis]KAA9105004.1 hypothetical protein F6B43_18320 [Microbacterium rhizomatis]